MSAKFEVMLYTSEIEILDSMIEKIQDTYQISWLEFEVMDDWSYTNHKKIPEVYQFELVKEYIKNRKIIMLGAKLNSNWNCGCQISKLNENSCEILFWIDTKGLEYLDDDCVNSESKLIYDEITKNVSKERVKDRFLIAAIGVEMSIEYNRDSKTMIKNSTGVNKWLLPSPNNS